MRTIEEESRPALLLFTVMTTAAEPDAPQAPEGIEVGYRLPARAAWYSALLPGAGQVYNRQLEKAVLLWIWTAIHAGAGALLLLLGLLGAWLPRHITRPPLGDRIADHALGVFLFWMGAGLALWGIAVWDARGSAERINRGEIVIRYPLKRQMVHVLASQLLGFIPFVGLFFPPNVVAEAVDAVHHRRGPDGKRLVREGGQALLEWALTRLALWGLWLFAGVWVLWWLLKAVRLAP